MVKEGRFIFCVFNVFVNFIFYYLKCCVLDGFYVEEIIYILLFRNLSLFCNRFLNIYIFLLFFKCVIYCDNIFCMYFMDWCK